MWKCDTCLTQAEANQAGSLKDVISSLVDRLNLLETKLSTEIKTQVSEAFTLLTASQSEEFDKLSVSIANKPSAPVKSNPTVWDNLSKVKEMKSSLMVKPDQHGVPIDKNKLKKIVMDNGVPVNKIVVSQSGDTFINMPSEKVRDKLHPLLGSYNEVVFLKKKLPSVKLLGITEKFTSDQIKTGLCNQNEAIGNLVNAGQELSVIYTKDPPQGKDYYQVTLRVSPDIRKAIKASGHKLFLSENNCKVVDNFHIKRCNRCQKFGHYANRCNLTTHEVCGYCGANHRSNACLIRNSPANTHKCINCATAGLGNEAEGHSTFSFMCPTYIIQQDKLKNSIAYDYSLNS